MPVTWTSQKSLALSLINWKAKDAEGGWQPRVRAATVDALASEGGKVGRQTLAFFP